MKGLLRNNFYATLSNTKIFAAIMLILDCVVVAIGNKIPSLVMGYMLLTMIGFSLNSIASLRKEGATKWNKYKLTTPETNCQGLFNQIHKNSQKIYKKGARSIVWLLTPRLIDYIFPFSRSLQRYA